MPRENSTRSAYAALLLSSIVASSGPVQAATELPAAPVAPVALSDAFHAMGKGERVEWRDWGPEVFAEAQRRGLPVLLNLGTMWCGPCQRMAAITYSDREVAELIEERFVPLKIDADRHPELYSRFAGAMHKIRDIGDSVPFTGFLTGEGRLFVAAGYFAPEDDESAGVAGIKTMLRAVDRQYQEDPKIYHNTAEEVANMQLQDTLDTAPPSGYEELGTHVSQAIIAAADSAWGGLGTGGKKPFVPAFLLILEDAMRGQDRALAFTDLTLGGMADGGIRDLLGVGFHASSRDRQWRIPRFEKLASVNAGLIEYFALGAKLTGVAQYERAAAGAVDLLLDTLGDRALGGVYQAQAAAVPGAEPGSAYTWRRTEVEALLEGPEEKMAIAFWGIYEAAFAIPEAVTANVIAVRRDYGEVLSENGIEPEVARKALFTAVDKLSAARAKRPQPPIDRTMYGATNGQAAHGLLVAAAHLNRADAREHALKTLDRFLATAWNDETGFARGLDADGKVIGDGILADQVHLAAALVDAYEATGEQRYLDRAIAAVELATRRFRDPNHPGLLDVPPAALAGYSVLILPARPVADDVVASDNGVLALTLLRLGILTGDGSYTDRADKLVRAVTPRAIKSGYAGATFARVAARLLAPAPRVLVVARARSAAGMTLAASAWTSLRPGVSVRWVASRSHLVKLFPAAAGLPEELQDDFAVALTTDGALVTATADAAELSRALRPPPPPVPAGKVKPESAATTSGTAPTAIHDSVLEPKEKNEKQ